MSNRQAEIWSRLIAPGTGAYVPAVANAILELDFDEADHERIAALSRKANLGDLTGDEREELEAFASVGHVLALLQSKARLSLRNSSAA